MFIYPLQIWAGLPTGSLVTNMFAKDLDAGENGTVTFSLVTGESPSVTCSLFMLTTMQYLTLGFCIILFPADFDEDDDLGHFEIDSKNGEIRTTELFSQDAELYYTLKVTARDGGASPREDTAVVHVQVQCLLHLHTLFYTMKDAT